MRSDPKRAAELVPTLKERINQIPSESERSLRTHLAADDLAGVDPQLAVPLVKSVPAGGLKMLYDRHPVLRTLVPETRSSPEADPGSADARGKKAAAR